MTNLLIGAGGHAKVVFDIAQENGTAFAAFCDPQVDSFQSLVKTDDIKAYSHFFVAVGATNPADLDKRQRLFLQAKGYGLLPLTLISQMANCSSSAEIGEGTVVARGAVLQSNCRIGSNSIINTGAIIEHDAVIENFCHIAPGAIILGGAVVGSGSMVGAGAVILPGVEIPESTLIPALTRYDR